MTSDYRLICDRVRQEGMDFPLPALAGGGVFPGLPAAPRINGGAHHQPR